MYSEIFDLHSELLKAIANPKRLEIIQLLRDRELTVSEIQRMLYLPQGNLSQHLQVLREASIVATRRAGKQIFYKLAHKNFAKASDLIRELLIQRNPDLSNELVKDINDFLPLVQDPVCGMRLSPKTASFAVKKNGAAYYFCASGCYEKFKNKPEKYSKEAIYG